MLPFHSRRITSILALFFIVSLVLSIPANAQKKLPVEVKVEQVSESIYMLTGKGGNIGVSIGEDGVFMIDGQYADMSAKILAAIKGISDKELQYLINTHWHGDHTGGNENFSKEGAVLVAHENVRKRMSTEQLMKTFSRTVPASSKDAWPMITFTDDLTMHLNGETIHIFHVHNAHTDGDAMVYFTESNVLHMGDCYFKGRYPFIDLSSGGSIDGIIKAANEVLFLINDATKIIPGHGSLSNKKELIAYRDVLTTIRNRVKTTIDEGKTLEAIKATKLTEEYDAEWGTGFINAEKIVDFIYTDLTRSDEDKGEDDQ